MSLKNSEIAHIWAHQLKESAKGSHFSFTGNNIFSYRACIGSIVKVGGKEIYLLDSEDYSISTTKHQWYVREAIPVDAIQFTLPCRNFLPCYFKELSKSRSIELVKLYIVKMYKSILKFKYSKSLKDERVFSILPYDEANRFCQLSKCTTLKQIYRNWRVQEIQGKYKIQDAIGLRRMLKALNNNERNLAKLIDITLGEGTYKTYEKRTIRARHAAYVRKINQYIGCDCGNNRWYSYYTPYRSPRIKIKSHTFLGQSCCPRVEGALSYKDIETLHKHGTFVKEIVRARRENLIKNLEYIEKSERQKRRQDSKYRLEEYIGLAGWRDHYYKGRFTSFDYNGTVWDFSGFETIQYLSWEEYENFAAMTKEQQSQFIHDKRDWMLEELRQQRQRREQYAKQLQSYEDKLREIERIRSEKAEYIKLKKAEGPDGIRELWHENLIDSFGLIGFGFSLFHGGNALLRVNKIKEIVETSKGIQVGYEECKRLWSIIKYWHDKGVTFKSSNESVHATTNNWSIARFQNDIMIAGCHAIHYSEMENVAKILGFTTY